jgi:hypothetical protein
LISAFDEARRRQSAYDRGDFVAEFSRENIMEKMARDVIGFAQAI